MTAQQVSLHAWVAFAELAGPILAIMLVIGVVTGAFQAATQIREPSIPFMLKMASLAALTSMAGPLIMRGIEQFATRLFSAIPGLLHG
ncbi:MAG: flagellar biosynthesis protein FliQ [Acidocella sp. 20-57-95]|nr:MAG: flagellar biosynthesis protein FliQ [Acidocella sp. 20-57-95]OYV58306.1 MAG: flagellar biosynthesis protein FliQ [Acidocella sp. 21-58-7]HQT63562.1 flagellar biosynthetic protein FliQ [Acidocella sp.]HQU05376.1 flagellar biosynthetic protein FliQ [Acidocella sp.]